MSTSRRDTRMQLMGRTNGSPGTLTTSTDIPVPVRRLANQGQEKFGMAAYELEYEATSMLSDEKRAELLRLLQKIFLRD